MKGNKMKNIELFNQFTGVALGTLYENFPVPIGLSASMMVENYLGEGLAFEPDILQGFDKSNDLDSNGYPRKKTQLFHDYEAICKATIVWLCESGYIKKTSNETRGSDRKYVLSTKGLEVLSAVPESLGEKSLGRRLVDATKNVAGDASKAMISETISQVIGAAFRAGIGAYVT
jgi:hypothetical protein